MKLKAQSNTDSLLSKALPGNDWERLAFLLYQTQMQSCEYGFFSHLCSFVVPFIRKSPLLQELRNQWDDARSEHARKDRSLQKQAIREIFAACQILKSRLKEFKAKDKKTWLNDVDEVVKVLESGGSFLGSPYYETASNKLWHLCRALAADDQKKLLEGIADVSYIHQSKFEDGKVKTWQEPHLESVHFKNALIALREHNQVINLDRTDIPWIIWEQLCLANVCWHLPRTHFDNLKLNMGSARNVQESNKLFNLHAYWREMQKIRQQQDQQYLVAFTRERYEPLLQHITSAIVCFQGLQENSLAPATAPIYALELILDQNELYLLIEWQKEGEISTYLLHTCQERSEPALFVRELFNRRGEIVSVLDLKIKSQTASKLLLAVKIKDPLRRLFFSKGETYSATLLQTRVILGNRRDADPVKIIDYIKCLKLQQIEGPLSRIEYEN